MLKAKKAAQLMRQLKARIFTDESAAAMAEALEEVLMARLDRKGLGEKIDETLANLSDRLAAPNAELGE